MVKRGRKKKVEAPENTSVEGASIPSLKQVYVKRRVTKARVESAPLSPPPGFAQSDSSPSLSRYPTRNSMKAVLDRCNAITAPLRPPIRNVKASYPSCDTGDVPAHLTTGIYHATVESQELGALGVENQDLEEKCERLASLPEVVVENDVPPNSVDVVLNTNATGSGNRSTGSGARPTKSGTVNFTKIAALMNDHSSDDEVESTLDHMSVMINRYRVKLEAAPVLQKIFLKYGDIAKAISSVNISSSLLEFVCDICRKLEAKDLRIITMKELQSLLAEVRDLESAKVDVGWLRQRLNDISGSKQLFLEHNKLKEAETIKKKTLGELKGELAACIASCSVLQERIRETEHELGIVHGENKKVWESYANTKGKKLLDLPKHQQLRLFDWGYAPWQGSPTLASVRLQ